MRIACLQLASRVGEVAENTKKADAMLDGADPDELRDLDLLVLPELALTGYNFHNLHHISPYLETAGSGSTATWAKSRAQTHGCTVIAGYPEEVRPSSPGTEGNHGAYNAAIIVDKSGSTVGNYRKSFLYYTDDTWAQEGEGFFQGELPGLGRVAVGICMDINPYKFEAPWEACEFGAHVVRVHANLVVVVMAWLTHTEEKEFLQEPGAPDMETVDYWVQRFQPLLDVKADGSREVLNEEVIVVCANRCGVEGNVVYAGTSIVMGITGTEIRVYGILGRGVESLLVVDTAEPPRMRLVRARRDGDRDQ